MGYLVSCQICKFEIEMKASGLAYKITFDSLEGFTLAITSS